MTTEGVGFPGWKYPSEVLQWWGTEGSASARRRVISCSADPAGSPSGEFASRGSVRTPQKGSTPRPPHFGQVTICRLWPSFGKGFGRYSWIARRPWHMLHGRGSGGGAG